MVVEDNLDGWVGGRGGEEGVGGVFGFEGEREGKGGVWGAGWADEGGGGGGGVEAWVRSEWDHICETLSYVYEMSRLLEYWKTFWCDEGLTG